MSTQIIAVLSKLSGAVGQVTSEALWKLLPRSSQGLEESLLKLIQKSRHSKQQLMELKQWWSLQEFSDEEADQYKRILEFNAQDLTRAIRSCTKLMKAVSTSERVHKSLKTLRDILMQHHEITQDLIEDLALIPELRQRLKAAKRSKGKLWSDLRAGLKSE